MDLVESLNRKIAGWAPFNQYTDYTVIPEQKPTSSAGPEKACRTRKFIAV
jgi:hypothetical protein